MRRLFRKFREILLRDVYSEIHLVKDELSAQIENKNAQLESNLFQAKDHLINELNNLNIKHTELFSKLDSLDLKQNISLETQNVMARNMMPPKTPEGKYKVIFLIHNINAFAAIEDVIKAMQKREELDVIVASIPHKFPGEPLEGIESDVHEFLEAKGISHVRLVPKAPYEALLTLKTMNPAVVFRQSQWDADYLNEFSSHSLSWARLCMVPYGGVLLVNAPNDSLFIDDEWYIRFCWRYFVPNVETVRELASNSPLLGKQCVVAGSTKLEQVKNGEVKDFALKEKRKSRVLWSSHHSLSEDWFSFGTFHYVYKDMLKWAKEESLKDEPVQFVFSPHPQLLRSVLGNESEFGSREELQAFLEEWEALPNCITFTKGNYTDLFASVDCLLTDGISYLAEFQITQKPVIFLERKEHAEFNANGKIMLEGVYTARNFSEAQKFIQEHPVGSENELKLAQESVVNKLYGTGGAAEKITDNVVKGLLES